jgi:hypothetical protein
MKFHIIRRKLTRRIMGVTHGIPYEVTHLRTTYKKQLNELMQITILYFGIFRNKCFRREHKY